MNRILLFHIGHLGDTLMVVPSYWALAKTFTRASFSLLTDMMIEGKYVPAEQLFRGTEFFEQILTFEKGGAAKRCGMAAQWSILAALRRYHYDAVAYLVPSLRQPLQVNRDKLFFRLAGINHFLGFKGFHPVSDDADGLHEAQRILHRLALDGVDCSETKFDLLLGSKEKLAVDRWSTAHSAVIKTEFLIAFAPGSKMQAKRWPLDRFADLGERILSRFRVTPVVVGGDEDRELGNELLSRWKCGLNAAGVFSVRESAELLRRCRLYIGNDTGAMHLAAAVQTHCLAIFSARDIPFKWHPFGEGHIVLRKPVDCQGCKLTMCSHQTCLQLITVDEAFEKALSMIEKIRAADETL